MSHRIQTSDKIDLHYRQQLSALIDGALAPDEARFLLRRMQHDGELADCWERWQLAGEVLRGRATTVLPAGFAMRVGAMIAADSAAGPQAPRQPRARWKHWGGSAALAASLAVVALLAWRQGPDADMQRQQAAPIVAATPAPGIESPRPDAMTPGQGVAGQARATSAADSVVVADAPRRPVQRPRPAQRTRAEMRASDLDAERVEVAAAPVPAMAASQSPRPFATGALPPTRPWPRAVLPQFGTGGALTTDADASTAPSFYPFEPRLPGDGAEPDAATPPTPR